MLKSSRHARVLAAGVSLLVFVQAPALAQNDPAPPAPAPAPAAAVEAGGANQAGDIIVTAQRRNERLRDVPISITAVNADTLAKAGVTSILDLQRVSVGVELPLYGGFVRPSIRGVSSGLSSLGVTSTPGTNGAASTFTSAVSGSATFESLQKSIAPSCSFGLRWVAKVCSASTAASSGFPYML